jgi:hypothetical protein
MVTSSGANDTDDNETLVSRRLVAQRTVGRLHA